MKVYNSFAKRMLLCVLVAACLACNVCAATWDKMRENGAVSDDGIRLGDAHDGIVSDVSEEGGPIGEIITDVSDAIDHGMDSILGEDTTVTTKATAPATTATTAAETEGAMEESGGMTMGIVIAILVVIAVVIVIFLLFPKRR